MLDRTSRGISIALTAGLLVPFHTDAQPRTASESQLNHQTQGPVTLSEPSIVWRNDHAERPRNAFGMFRNAFSADGRLLGIIEQPDRAWILNAADGSLMRELPYSSTVPGAYSVAFSQTCYAAIGRLRTAEVFDISTGMSVGQYSCIPCTVIDAIAFSSDGALLALQSGASPLNRQSGQTLVVDVTSGRYVASLEDQSNRPHVSFSPDGRKLVTSSFTRSAGATLLGFRVRSTEDWETTLRYPDESDGQLGFMAIGRIEGFDYVAVYGQGDALEMRDLSDDRVIWTAPLIPPQFAPSTSVLLGSELDRVAITPNGRFVISYESPIAHDPIGHASGAIAVRDAMDGRIVAVYEIYSVTGLAVAPDSQTFVYSTGAGRAHTALVRLPP